MEKLERVNRFFNELEFVNDSDHWGKTDYWATPLGRVPVDRKAVEAALRYLILGLLGSLLFVAGVALTYAGYGTLDLMKLRDLLAPEPVAWIALALMISGLSYRRLSSPGSAS